MRYYKKNGQIIARSYPFSRGYVFEIGSGGSKTPCIMNNFSATKSVRLSSLRELRREEKALGEVEIEELEE